MPAPRPPLRSSPPPHKLFSQTRVCRKGMLNRVRGSLYPAYTYRGFTRSARVLSVCICISTSCAAAAPARKFIDARICRQGMLAPRHTRVGDLLNRHHLWLKSGCNTRMDRRGGHRVYRVHDRVWLAYHLLPLTACPPVAPPPPPHSPPCSTNFLPRGAFFITFALNYFR